MSLDIKIQLVYLKNLIQIAHDINNIKYVNVLSEQFDIINNNNEILYSDDYIYKKQWNKLNNIHKIIKIKEFLLNSYNIPNELEKEILLKFELMIEKKILNKNVIFYDVNDAKILSIKNFNYDNENNSYLLVN